MADSEFKKLSDVISISSEDSSVFLVNNEWTFRLPDHIQYKIRAEFDGGYSVGVDLSGTQKEMILKGMKSGKEYKFNVALNPHYDAFGYFSTAEECRNDSRENDEDYSNIFSRSIVTDENNLYVDMVSINQWPLGIEVWVRVRGAEIHPFNFFTVLKSFSHDDFDKIAKKLKEIAKSIKTYKKPAAKKSAAEKTTAALKSTAKKSEPTNGDGFINRAVMKKDQWSIGVPDGFEFCDEPEKNYLSPVTGERYNLAIVKPAKGKKACFHPPYENEMSLVSNFSGDTGLNGTRLDAPIAEIVLSNNIDMYKLLDLMYVIDTPVLKVGYQAAYTNSFLVENDYAFTVLIITPYRWTIAQFLITNVNKTKINKGEKILKSMLKTVLSPQMSEDWDKYNETLRISPETAKPKTPKSKKNNTQATPAVSNKTADRSYYNPDIYNKLEKYKLTEPRIRMLNSLRYREQLDNPQGCDLMLKKFIRPEKNVLLEKAYMQYYKDDDEVRCFNEIRAAAKKYAKVFRVNPDVFNPECDTEAEIYAGYIKHISASHALKSLATMIYPYSKKVNKEYCDITIEELYNMAYKIEDCGGTNFIPYVTNGDQWLLRLRRRQEIKYFYCCSHNNARNSYFSKDYIIKNYWLSELIHDLHEIMPVMQKIYEHLSENRDRNVYLKCTLSKMLSAWCTFALASDEQFSVEKGIDSYFLSQRNDSVEDEPVLYKTTDDGIVYYDDFMLDYIGEDKTLTVPAFIKKIPYDFVAYGKAEHVIFTSPETDYGRLNKSKVTVVEAAKDTVVFDRGCYNNDIITEVILPENLQEIGDWSFSSCPELKSVNIPDTVKEIGEGALCNCAKLSLTIPASVNEISIRDSLLTQSFEKLKHIKAYRDSYAARWLIDNNIPFETILSEEQKEADRLKAKRDAEERERRLKEAAERKKREKAARIAEEKRIAELLERSRKEVAERKRREEEARIAEEKRIAAERKAVFDRLTAEKEEQLKIIEENKGIFGQKAKNRKEAKKRLKEILSELGKYPEFNKE